MATLIVPPILKNETKLWATLGDQVAGWIEENAVWGPGSKFGQSVTIDDEFYEWLLRAYQIFPAGHAREGRRRFDLCALELAKGTGKTERALLIGQAEFHPGAPVRCHGFRKVGRARVPEGGATPYPRLVFVASSEDQVQRTAFGRFRASLKKSPNADLYHVTLDKILLLGADGQAVGEAYPLAVSPDTADGDLPTFQHVDEPHRWDMPRHHQMFDTISENALKDVDADAWMMTTSTAGLTGDNSVEEQLLHTAEAVERGEVEQPNMFFMRRFCPDDWPIDTFEETEKMVREARGPAAEWSGDIPRIVAKRFDPKTDLAYWRRVWGNQWVKGGGRAFDPNLWESLSNPGYQIPPGAFVTLGFDGAKKRDATGIVATEISTGFQQMVAVWERPYGAGEDWEVPALEVDAEMTVAFDRWDVWRLYADPPYWDEWITEWEGRWTSDRVVKFWTNKVQKTATAMRAYESAMTSRQLSHDGDPMFGRHIKNAVRRNLPQRDERDVQLWCIGKDRADSPDKIDLAMAGCLSWEARRDAVTSGAKPTKKRSKKLVTF